MEKRQVLKQYPRAQSERRIDLQSNPVRWNYIVVAYPWGPNLTLTEHKNEELAWAEAAKNI